MIDDKFVYNNEEEAEMGQVAAIHISEDAVAKVRAQLPTGNSFSHCEECGEDIPEERRKAFKGVRTCTFCQEQRERKL